MILFFYGRCFSFTYSTIVEEFFNKSFKRLLTTVMAFFSEGCFLHSYSPSIYGLSSNFAVVNATV